MALYHLKTSEKDTKFPSTVSYCVRKGIPYGVFNGFIWAGWILGVIKSYKCSGKLFKSLLFTMMIEFALAMGVFTI